MATLTVGPRVIRDTVRLAALEVPGVLRVLRGADLAPHCDPWVATLAHLKGMKSAAQLPPPSR